MSSTSTAFMYNDANELESMTENGVLTTSFSYDDWGRTTGKTQGAYEATYTWRYGDKLKYVESDFPGEAATVSYIYDGLGKRRTKYVNGSDWTHYRWDRGWNMIAEYDHGASEWDIGNLADTFIPGLAEVPGTTPATGNYRYYETDHLGTVKGILSQSQATLANYDYSPYGEPYYQAGLALNRGFTGHTWEKEIGQYYAPFRYYNSASARWLSSDPVGMVDGTNMYLYAGGDPSRYVDPLGDSIFAGACIAGGLFQLGKDLIDIFTNGSDLSGGREITRLGLRAGCGCLGGMASVIGKGWLGGLLGGGSAGFLKCACNRLANRLVGKSNSGNVIKCCTRSAAGGAAGGAFGGWLGSGQGNEGTAGVLKFVWSWFGSEAHRFVDCDCG